MGDVDADLQLQAAIQCAARHCERAISLLEASLERLPSNAELSHQIGLCYSGACRMHTLTSLPLAIAYFERALRIIGPGGSGTVRAKYLESLAHAHLLEGQPTSALPCLEEAAQVYRRGGGAEEWARVEFNLGNVCCDLAEQGAPSWWETAIAHYGNALSVRRKKGDPLRFAATAQNLGTAYRSAPGRNRGENLRKAIGLYCAAFGVYSGAHMRKKCADLHNNLGNVLLEMPSPPTADCRNTRRALRHFSLALRVRTKQECPRDYAVTQLNRGEGFLQLVSCDSSGAIRSAVNCFLEALDGFLLVKDESGAELARSKLRELTGACPPGSLHN